MIWAQTLVWSGFFAMAVVGMSKPGWADAALSAPNAPLGDVVYCYDRARDVVVREIAANCHGETLNEDAANAVKARRNAEVSRALAAQKPQNPVGMRLTRIGTAFYVDERGRLLTNDHVVEGCSRITVRPQGQEPIAAAVVALDAGHDIALVQVEENSPAIAEFRDGPSTAGDRYVATVGYAGEEVSSLTSLDPLLIPGTLLKGFNPDSVDGSIVLGINLVRQNGGGPILDSRGLVIGIVNKRDADTISVPGTKRIDNTAVGISAPTLLSFLTRTETRFRIGRGSLRVDAADLLRGASTFLARVECWTAADKREPK